MARSDVDEQRIAPRSARFEAAWSGRYWTKVQYRNTREPTRQHGSARAFGKITCPTIWSRCVISEKTSDFPDSIRLLLEYVKAELFRNVVVPGGVACAVHRRRRERPDYPDDGE